jgi:hypothetical protein
MRVHISFLLNNDCLKHNTVAVHLFQSKLCSFLPGKLKDLTKIYCSSDGAASRCKNGLNFINFCYLFCSVMDTKCHFSATSHGKGVCDETGETIKNY